MRRNINYIKGKSNNKSSLGSAVINPIINKDEHEFNYFKLVGFFIAFLSGWIPFFGYGYMKGRLEALGFPNVYVDASIQDMFFIFLEAITPKLIGLINGFESFILWILLISITSVVLFLAFVLRDSDGFSSLSSNDIFFLRWFKKLFDKSNYSFLGKTKVGLILVSLVFSLLSVMGVVILAILSYGWFLGVGGYAAGLNAGKNELAGEFCFQNDDKVCLALIINNRSVPVHLLHSDNRYQYVATCEGIYQLDAQNAVHLFKPWTNRCAGSKADAG